MAFLYDTAAPNLLDLQGGDSKYGLLIPNRLFVGALGDDVAETDLRNFFTNFGPLKYCKVLVDANGNSKGYGFVTFVHSEDVDKLLKKGDELMIKNKKINIGPAIRKQQTVRPQIMNAGQVMQPGMNAAHMMGGQGNLLMANGMPCLIQGASHPTSIMDPTLINNPLNLSYPSMGMIAGPSTGTLKQPGMHLMLLPQHLEQQLMHPSSFNHNQISQRQQQHMATPSMLSPGVYPPQLQQQQHKQQPHIYIPSMASSLVSGALSMDQCLYQLPYVMQSQQQQQQLQQHQLHQQHMLNDAIPIDILQQQQQQYYAQNIKQEQQYIVAQNKSFGSSLQYLELSDLAIKRASSDNQFTLQQQQQQQQQQLIFSSGNQPSTSSTNNDTRRALKRSLTLIQQNDHVTKSSFHDNSLYGVPAVKVLAGESQQRIVRVEKEAMEENAGSS